MLCVFFLTQGGGPSPNSFGVTRVCVCVCLGSHDASQNPHKKTCFRARLITLGKPDSVDHRDWRWGPNDGAEVEAEKAVKGPYDNRLCNLQATGVLQSKKSNGLSIGETQDN